jgi:hypothetical protein
LNLSGLKASARILKGKILKPKNALDVPGISRNMLKLEKFKV